MNSLKIYLGLFLAFFLFGCDDTDDPDDGDASTEDASVSEPDAALASLQYIMISDISEDQNSSGTPGVDICGVWVECGDVEVTVTTAELVTDDEEICGEGDDGCSTARDNPDAAKDTGEACAGDSNPSDYVSLGMSGALVLDFSQDLDGCTVHIIELDGGDAEGAEVSVCSDSDDLATCEKIGEFETEGDGSRAGEEHSFPI